MPPITPPIEATGISATTTTTAAAAASTATTMAASTTAAAAASGLVVRVVGGTRLGRGDDFRQQRLVLQLVEESAVVG